TMSFRSRHPRITAGPAGASHSNSTCGIKTTATFRSKNTAQGTAQIFESDFHKSKFCIERHVPRYVSESRETYERTSSRGGPVTDCHYQPRTNASLSVIRVDINLCQMSDRGFEYLDVCKPNGNSFDQCDPKVAAAVRMLKFVEARRFGQDSIRCISN